MSEPDSTYGNPSWQRQDNDYTGWTAERVDAHGYALQARLDAQRIERMVTAAPLTDAQCLARTLIVLWTLVLMATLVAVVGWPHEWLSLWATSYTFRTALAWGYGLIFAPLIMAAVMGVFFGAIQFTAFMLEALGIYP